MKTKQQILDNARALNQAREWVRGNVKRYAAPLADPEAFAREYDRELSSEWARLPIPVDTGALREALTTPGHPNKKTETAGDVMTVTVYHPAAKYRFGIIPQPRLASVLRLAVESVRRLFNGSTDRR